MFANSKKSAQQTAQRFIAGHFTLTAWWALKHAGVFDAMVKLEDSSGEGLHPLVHAARTNMAPDILDALFDYLATTGLVIIKDGQARLTPEARALLEHEDGVLELVHAYQPILDMAEHMLARLKTGIAGAPVHRKSDALTESQAKRFAAEVYPAVLALLAKYKLSHLLDLSCGAGNLLMYLSENSKNIVGVGIGADGPNVRRANHAITEAKGGGGAGGLEKRLIAMTANPLDVCTDTQRTFDRIGISRQLWDELDCLIAPQLFSDLATRESPPVNGQPAAVNPLAPGGAVIRALASIPKKFPNAHLLVIEPTASPRFDKNYYAPELNLLFRLSKTTPWSVEKWRELFQQAKMQIVAESPLTTDGITLFLCKPA